jgi:hypothetical protein
MAGKGRFYRVGVIGSGLRRSYPLKEVRPGTVVQSLETAPQGSLDVVDVLVSTGRVKSVYSFQLRHVIKKPKMWGKR